MVKTLYRGWWIWVFRLKKRHDVYRGVVLALPSGTLSRYGISIDTRRN